MPWIITKYLITAAIVVAVSELAKCSDLLGAQLASLPLVTLLALTLLYQDKQSSPCRRLRTAPGIPSGTSCRRCRCSFSFRGCLPASASGPRRR